MRAVGFKGEKMKKGTLALFLGLLICVLAPLSVSCFKGDTPSTGDKENSWSDENVDEGGWI